MSSTLALSSSLTPMSRMRSTSRVEHVARQAVFRDAEAHHAAGKRPRLADRHVMAEAGADDRRPERPAGPAPTTSTRLPCLRAGFSNFQPLSIARSPRKRSTELMPTALSMLRAIAGGLAGMIADAAHHGRQRVVVGQRAPRGLVVAGFRVNEPALNVLARRAGGVAGRQAVDIDRAARCARSRYD